MDLIVGHYYRAKRTVPVGFFTHVVNDRKILWISPSGEQIQYDSPTVKFGRPFPRVTRESFLKWAELDVTEEYQKLDDKQEWQLWDVYRINRPHRRGACQK